MGNIWGNSRNRVRLYFFGAPKSLQMVTVAMKLKDAYSFKENYDQPRQDIEKQRLYLAKKCLSSQGYSFSSSHVWMWLGLRRKLSAKELMLLNCGVGRRLLRVLWTTSRSNQSILNEISPGCSLEGMMLTLKLQYFGHLMQRVDSLEKTDAERDWGQEKKGKTEDEMAGWHHRLDGCKFEWTPGVGDGQGGLICCNSWSLKDSDTTERLNWRIYFIPWNKCFSLRI